MAGPTWENPADASLILAGEQVIGILGSLGARLMDQYKLRQPVFLAEIDFEALTSWPFRRFSTGRWPDIRAVERDLSVVDQPGYSLRQNRGWHRRTGNCRIDQGIRLIDIYEGEKIPAGKISMTLRFTFQDREKTLTVDRVQGFSDNILAHLRNSYGAELRTL